MTDDRATRSDEKPATEELREHARRQLDERGKHLSSLLYKARQDDAEREHMEAELRQIDRDVAGLPHMTLPELQDLQRRYEWWQLDRELEQGG